MAEAGALRALKSPTVKRWVYKHLTKGQQGKLWNVVGHQFEEFLASYVFRGAQKPTPTPEGRVADFVWKTFWIEAKTSLELGERELSQLSAFKRAAEAEGHELVFLFLVRPTNGTITTLSKAGAQAVWLFDAFF